MCIRDSPHEDHAGGVRAVIQRFPVNLVLISPVGDEGEQIDPGYTQLIRDIKQKGILVQERCV